MLTLASACKTVDETPAQLEAVADAALVPPRPAQAEDASADALAGYDRQGASSCLPLPVGRTCLVRSDRLATACGAAGGETLVCEDCKILCSQPLTIQ